MTPHVATVDLDSILQRWPDLTVLQLLEDRSIQQRFAFADVVRLIYTDLKGNRSEYIMSRDLKVNEQPPSEELQ